jgi:hypothetical protein
MFYEDAKTVTVIDPGSNSSRATILLNVDEIIVESGTADIVNCPNASSISIGAKFSRTIRPFS